MAKMLTDQEIATQAEALKKARLVDLEALVDAMDPLHRADVGRRLDWEIVHLARVAGYVGARGPYEQGHGKAVRAQNSLVTKIRRALGFSIPKDDLSF